MNDDNQYLQMFFDESEEYIQTLNESILNLENNPDDEETIHALFRAAHSLKGMAATMGFDTLTELTHKIENLMDRVRNQELVINTELIDLLFAGIDHIENIVNHIKENGEENIEVDDYLNELAEYLEQGETKTPAVAESAEGEHLELTSEELSNIKDNLKENNMIYSVETYLKPDISFPNARASMVLRTANDIGHIVKTKPAQENIEEADFEDNKLSLILVTNLSEQDLKEELNSINDIEKVEIKELKTENIKKETKKDKKSKSKSSDSDSSSSNSGFQVSSTVRVDIDRLDKLMNMIGELLINKTRLQALDIDDEDFQEVLPQLDRTTTELHHTVMQVRMEPVGVMFNRFPRMIRDLSKQEQKEIDFTMEGEDTELDRSIIDELGDPLTHLLRNSIDHGIEKPEVREEKGKDPQGMLALRAYQKGSEIMIEVEDDGAGIDSEKLVDKALDKELITSSEAEEMDEKQKLNLIFHPGLSTTEEVSDISGRGVGMDVVKRTVEDLDGQVFIDSTVDEGTKITLSLPLTLAITEALMVKINKETFAIPLNNIEETLRMENNELKKVRGRDVITLRDQTIPLLDSRERLNLNTDYKLYQNQDEFSAVLIRSSGSVFGLVVDELLQQQEIVIKSLGNYLDNVENISGATIIGDGEVALILDVRNIA